MNQYLNLLAKVALTGTVRTDRTGTGTIGVFGEQIKFHLADGFPLLTTKKVHFKSIVHELLWFLSGDTNIKYLQDNGVKIWDEWADEFGNLGPVYGHQWRRFGESKTTLLEYETPYLCDSISQIPKNWNPRITRKQDIITVKGIDQISNLIEGLKKDPFSRRHIVSAWNPVDVPNMALPPCHTLFQFHVEDCLDGKRYLNCQLYQRSADLFLGVPFNIASYALLTHMVAQVVGMEPGNFIHTFGDLHIYQNHREQVAEQLMRNPTALPKLKLNSEIKDIFGFKYEDIELIGYNPQSAIKAKVAV